MREIVHIQVGQCGNQIGTKFWESINQEHGLNADGTYAGTDERQLEKIDVYYKETDSDRFVPRAVLVDTEKSVLNHIRQREFGGMFHPNNILTSQNGCANNFMNGCYGVEAMDLCDKVLQCLRREVERTECCQGFTFSHSSAGGTGSGLTMQIWESASDILIKNRNFGGHFFFTVFPSQKISNVVLEPYNTCLTLEKQKTVENVVCLDNEALYRICTETLGLRNTTFGDMNRVVSMAMAGTTASFRFPGQINTDMQKLSYSLRCSPFYHYYIPSFAPLTSQRNMKYRKITVSELVRQMVQEENMMFESVADPADLAANEGAEVSIDGRCFAYAALFRGEMCTQDVDESLSYLKGNQDLENQLRSTIGYLEENRNNYTLKSVMKSQLYHSFNPRPTFNTITDYAAPGMPISCTYLRNTSQVKHKFLKILRQAMRMYSTGVFAEWYREENFPQVEVKTTLESCLQNQMDEWLPEFGVGDQSNWPEQITYDDVTAAMVADDPEPQQSQAQQSQE